MEQQSTSATPSKRQDYVQYTPQLVINYNQQYSHNQEQGLASPSQEHAEDSMLELKDVDTLPSNYSFVSHQIPNIPNNNNMYPIPQQQQQQPMMVQPQQVIYLPAETQQRVYETPSNNNYMHPGMIMNPNVPENNNHHMPTSPEASLDMKKYTTWTRVVMIFAIILGIYGCFATISQLLMIFSLVTMPSSNYATVSIPSIILSSVIAILEVATGAVGVWSTVTKNIKHRKYTTIAHLALLSVVVVINVIYGIVGNLQLMSNDTTQFSQAFPKSSWTTILVFSILFYILLIFACCGSCIGCQAYRFRIISKIQGQPETAQGEGFMVMRDEA